MKHYILIEVREPANVDFPGYQVAALRRIIHSFAMERGINIADTVVREDRPITMWGAPSPYQETVELFAKSIPPRELRERWRKLREQMKIS